MTICLLCISASGLIGAFLKGRQKDRCLKQFNDNHVHIYKTDDKILWGLLNIESNCFTFTMVGDTLMLKLIFIIQYFIP